MAVTDNGYFFYILPFGISYNEPVEEQRNTHSPRFSLSFITGIYFRLVITVSRAEYTIVCNRLTLVKNRSKHNYNASS